MLHQSQSWLLPAVRLKWKLRWLKCSRHLWHLVCYVGITSGEFGSCVMAPPTCGITTRAMLFYAHICQTWRPSWAFCHVVLSGRSLRVTGQWPHSFMAIHVFSSLPPAAPHIHNSQPLPEHTAWDTTRNEHSGPGVPSETYTLVNYMKPYTKVYFHKHTPWCTTANIHPGVLPETYTLVYCQKYTPWYILVYCQKHPLWCTTRNIHPGATVSKASLSDSKWV